MVASPSRSSKSSWARMALGSRGGSRLTLRFSMLHTPHPSSPRVFWRLLGGVSHRACSSGLLC